MIRDKQGCTDMNRHKEMQIQLDAVEPRQVAEVDKNKQISVFRCVGIYRNKSA